MQKPIQYFKVLSQLLWLLSIGLLSAICSIALAQSPTKPQYEDLKTINETAIHYIRDNIPTRYTIDSLQSSRIDSRLKLLKCQQSIYADSHGDFRITNQYTVAVRCDQPVWKIYVSIKAKISHQVVVAKDTIFRNQLIQPSQLKLEKRGVKRSQRYIFTRIDDVAGKQAKRNINLGSTIVANQLKAPLLVKRRQKVTILAENQILQVKMQGIALKNGKQNDLIKVRNINSNKVIEGIVVSQGVVRVNF